MIINKLTLTIGRAIASVPGAMPVAQAESYPVAMQENKMKESGCSGKMREGQCKGSESP